MSAKKTLLDLLNKYESILTTLEEEQSEVIPGRVEVFRKCLAGYQYLYISKDTNTGSRTKRYLSNAAADDQIAYKLAQQTYEQDVRKLLTARIPQLKTLVREFEDDELERLYTKLHPGRRVLVKPVEPTQAQRLQRWKNIPYEGLKMWSQELYFETNNGEMVRSKSEKILADRFLALGIPYKYECPLNMRNRVTLYPDFTFDDSQNNREIYWEHFGMMGDHGYAKKAYQKLDDYAQRGIVLGNNLIATFEMSDKPLNLKQVNALIKYNLGGIKRM